MTSDRMMQAIGRLDRAMSRLETQVGRASARVRAAESELARQRAATTEAARQRAEAKATRDLFAPPAPEPDPLAMNAFSHDKALAALRSLDSLIDDLQKARRDG